MPFTLLDSRGVTISTHLSSFWFYVPVAVNAANHLVTLTPPNPLGVPPQTQAWFALYFDQPSSDPSVQPADIPYPAAGVAQSFTIQGDGIGSLSVGHLRKVYHLPVQNAGRLSQLHLFQFQPFPPGNAFCPWWNEAGWTANLAFNQFFGDGRPYWPQTVEVGQDGVNRPLLALRAPTDVAGTHYVGGISPLLRGSVASQILATCGMNGAGGAGAAVPAVDITCPNDTDPPGIVSNLFAVFPSPSAITGYVSVGAGAFVPRVPTAFDFREAGDYGGHPAPVVAERLARLVLSQRALAPGGPGHEPTEPNPEFPYETFYLTGAPTLYAGRVIPT